MLNKILRNRKALALFTIFFSLLSLYSYKSFTSYRAPEIYNWESDFARDLYFMQRIGKGDIILIGPQLSFAGLRLAPYHFYLFAPILKLFNNWRAVIIANSLLFSFSLTLLFLFLSQKSRSIFYSLLATLWLATSPYFIFSARSPGNATSYLPFLILYLLALHSPSLKNSLYIVIIGFLAGFIVNFHPASLPVVFFAFLASLLSKKVKIKKFLFWFLGFLLSFTPVLLFEIKHKFVILKGFLTGKTADYMGNLGLLGGIKFKNGELILISLLKQTSDFLPGGLLLLLFLFLLALNKDKKARAFSIASLLSWIIFLLFGRGVYHYFSPYLLFSQLIIVFALSFPQTFLQKAIIIFLLVLNLLNFPLKYYKPARSLTTIEKPFEKFLSQNRIPTSLNVLLINNNPLASLGWEYRYLLERASIPVMREYEYQKSKHLLVISETGPIDFEKIRNFEFMAWKDNKKFRKTLLFKQGNFWYYLLERNEK